MRNRLKTGIVGMDKMLDGGIPEGNQVILAGGPGSGKTLIAFEFLYRGAKTGQTGVFFSFDEDSSRIAQNAKDAFSEFGDIDKLLSEKKLVIYGSEETHAFIQKNDEQALYTFNHMISKLQTYIELIKAKRVVIDSVSFMKLFIKDQFDYRALSVGLLTMLTRAHVTSLITMEVESQEKANVTFQQEFFVYDGLILLYFTDKETKNRTPIVEIMKMRGTRHMYSAVPYEITSSGINITMG